MTTQPCWPCCSPVTQNKRSARLACQPTAGRSFPFHAIPSRHPGCEPALLLHASPFSANSCLTMPTHACPQYQPMVASHPLDTSAFSQALYSPQPIAVCTPLPPYQLCSSTPLSTSRMPPAWLRCGTSHHFQCLYSVGVPQWILLPCVDASTAGDTAHTCCLEAVPMCNSQSCTFSLQCGEHMKRGRTKVWEQQSMEEHDGNGCDVATASRAHSREHGWQGARRTVRSGGVSTTGVV